MRLCKKLILAILCMSVGLNSVLANTLYLEHIYNRIKPIKVNSASEANFILELYDSAISETELLKLRFKTEGESTLLDQLQYKVDVCRQRAYMKAKQDFTLLNSEVLPNAAVDAATQEVNYILASNDNTDCGVSLTSYMDEVSKKH